MSVESLSRHEFLLTLDKGQIASLYRKVFSTDEGLLVLEDLANRCYLKTSTAVDQLTGMHLDPIVMQRNEGMRMVALHINDQVNYEPKKEELEKYEE